MLEKIIDNTMKYLEDMPKSERKKYGQFFTSKETARYMASLFHIDDKKEELFLLDAGAGSGILTCAFVEQIQNTGIKRLNVTCYETDENILGLLQKNLEIIQELSTTDIKYYINTNNYITSQYLDFNNMIGGNENPIKYDVIIGNPPYMKISKDAPEAIAMPKVCYGAPNMYFLFAAMGIFNLKEDCEMVYIIPRSWTSGAYFKKFREYFLDEGKLEHIHLFESRNKVFDKENVLQETIIIKVRKTKCQQDTIMVSSTETNNDFDNIRTLTVPYDIVISGTEKYVYLLTNEEDVQILKCVNKFQETLPSIGLKMKTGLTVDFRNRDILRNENEEGAIPLFYAQHIKDGMVTFPINKEAEYVVTEQKGLRQLNKNYLFVKRFTAKEEKRRLQCGLYLAKNFSEYESISTQNKINFIEGLTVEMSECLLYGLFVVFNSSLYDKYYRILNGSTQVNSTEINNMPIPNLEVIQNFGRELIKSKDLSTENCDRIMGGCYV